MIQNPNLFVPEVFHNEGPATFIIKIGGSKKMKIGTVNRKVIAVQEIVCGGLTALLMRQMAALKVFCYLPKL